MSWLASPDRRSAATTSPDAGPTPFEALLGLRPELLREYRHFYGALWDAEAAPARLLELCRLWIAALHGCAAESGIEHAGAGVSEVERARLARGERPPTLSTWNARP